jgi:hypothetical protein
MSFSGDITKLDNIARSLRALASVPSRAATPIAEGITKLLQKEFRAGTNPYGQAWRSLAKATIDKGRHPPPLTDTGDARDATRAYAKQGAGVAIFLPSPLNFHQTGYRNARTGRKVGPRAVLPNKGLPASWKMLIDKEVRKAFRSAA